MWVPIVRGRLLSLRQVVNSLYTRKYADQCDAHMNELPIPCGPWDIYYKDRQAFYNKILAGGAIWWTISLILMVWSGSFYLNWAPPLNPGPPSDMVDECQDDSES
ncbi:uncharacterized protein LOC113232010 isoform X2 [Hyposmocoma kahamanoa]|uniref:uncharacterized protein LOC113232010 isoform X2 n=1 Tax=Hyposmocoma kahamanoa TaxID=1477025 RepID=UPI000E6D8E17|nr:uncharacterized protein LOC113232010 isoform X2 [Hyposmocoma kahamanoa]